jgi:hypothetical protein
MHYTTIDGLSQRIEPTTMHYMHHHWPSKSQRLEPTTHDTTIGIDTLKVRITDWSKKRENEDNFFLRGLSSHRRYNIALSQPIMIQRQ